MSRRFRIPSFLGALLLAATTVGCASAPTLVDETKAQPFASYLTKDRQLQSSFHRVEAGDAGHPLKLNVRAVQSRSGRSKQLLVFLPGIMATHRTYRFLTGFLADYDMLILDPPAMGDSDAPKIKTLAHDCYSPAWLARHMLRAARAWQAERNDRRALVLIGHSLGGSVVIRCLADPSLDQEFGELRKRIDRVVLIAPGDVAIEKPHPTFRKLATTPGWQYRIGSTFGVLRRQIETSVHESVVDPKNALQAEADSIVTVLSHGSSRRATKEAIFKFTYFDLKTKRQDWGRVQEDEKIYARIKKGKTPCLVLWGRRDETLGVATGYKVSTQLGAKFVIVERAKHSPHHERAEFIAKQILEFLRE